MKSHVVLLGKVLTDVGIWCNASTSLDYETVKTRVEHEGFSFLTITLPSFAKDFERSLELGKIDSTLFQGFRRSASLPAFLQGLTSQVFDRSAGTLLDNPSIEAIRSVRQVCYLFQKIELPCSENRIKAAFDKYIECEQSVARFDESFSSQQKADFVRISNLLFAWDVFVPLDRKIQGSSVVPKHGPGATADRIKANAKFDQRTWTDRLEEFFPAGEFLFTSHRHYLNSLDDGVGPNWLEPGTEIPVKVITVPKTLKTPRIIAIEPTHMQYVQQGLMEFIVNRIERDKCLTQFIGFRDQEVNRLLAEKGSSNGQLATLDLSEASDRVSNLHVMALFDSWPWISGAVQACRSTKADVPGYGIIPLSKFASMGSALTFPVEAMVFLTIIFLGIEKELRVPLTRKLLKEFLGKVRVYGDDIIVPVHMVESVIHELESFGLRVNGHKSFWNGKFRESCGGDFYDGFDVNSVKARHILPTSRQHVEEITSVVSLRNQLYEAGLWRSANYLDDTIGRLIPFPSVHRDSPCMGRWTFHDYESHRMCPNLQRDLVRGYRRMDRTPKSMISGHGALLKFFLKRGFEPLDKDHLERAGRPRSPYMKLGWYTPY